MAISGSSLKSPISNLKFRNLTFSTAQHVCKLHWEPAHICTIAFRSPLQATPRIGFGEEKCAGIGIFHGES